MLVSDSSSEGGRTANPDMKHADAVRQSDVGRTILCRPNHTLSKFGTQVAVAEGLE